MGSDDTPQPDNYLRVLPEFGGQSRNEGKYVGGASELLVEVCVSRASYDLNQKLELYERAGVPEYLAVLMREQEIDWRRLTRNGYPLLKPTAGIWKSKIFPGLWLDGEALLAHDSAKVLATLQQGLQSPEHAAFVTKMAKKKSNRQALEQTKRSQGLECSYVPRQHPRPRRRDRPSAAQL